MSFSEKEITCNACFVHGEGDIHFEPHQVKLAEGEILVKVTCGGICGSDVHYYQHGRAGMSVLHHPMIIGHEFVGKVCEVNSDDERFCVGQPVVVNPSRPCNECPECLTGHQNLCQSMRFMGSAQFNPHVNGGFSEYVAVKPEQCLPYSEQVSPKVMAFSEPLSVAIHAVNVAGQLTGKKVLVIGAGPIGCLILAAAKCAGASIVVASDLSQRCRELASQMGASTVFDPTDDSQVSYYQNNRGYFDVVFEASGASAAIASTVDFTHPNGVIVQIGMGASPMTWPVSSMLAKEISFKGSFRFVHEFATSVQWLEQGRVDPTPLISAEFSPDQVQEALITAGNKEISSKVLINFE
ncbi:L-idonate 5-dehydrogenase [Celerinatantimonas diazotrophica]|uniref:L-idonate 5-dehydrogenase n=1 Tax=Celerinatantimonas diazotrophica TaxID=412034 RepID=A0A4V2PNC6_9GAMM|nr:L-idonate 5-dehydrogenase [Celerinatantimonas diazotrophica]TCK46358.1 L-idonate 5-dehydrogenase [Celerinatantimonas diazotrophica]CAG9295268.1 L-idonate 5-dehydrogenase (NAD(P)(+)) [Celerinatantimonas diazotrophica]